MLKKIKVISMCIATTFLFTMICYSQDPVNPEDFVIVSDRVSKDVLERNSSLLEVTFSLAKTNYLLFEPMIVKVRFTNSTEEQLKVYDPQLGESLSMETTFNSKVETTSSLGRAVSGPPRIRILKSGRFFERTILIKPARGLFKDPGVYEVQFFLKHLKERQRSQIFSIDITSPQGAERDAVEYLRTNLGAANDMFQLKTNATNQKEAELLEEFVDRYGQTAYGEYAIYQLAIKYNTLREFDKAENELKKIKDSQNILLAEKANWILKKIGKRKARTQGRKI